MELQNSCDARLPREFSLGNKFWSKILGLRNMHKFGTQKQWKITIKNVPAHSVRLAHFQSRSQLLSRTFCETLESSFVSSMWH